MGPCGEFHIPPIMFGSSGGSSHTTTATTSGGGGATQTPTGVGRLSHGSRKIIEVNTPMQKKGRVRLPVRILVRSS